MELETRKLTRLSICECGFHVLKDEIGLGTEYKVDPSSVQGGFYFQCGGCGKEQEDVKVIFCTSRLNPDAPLRPLPLAIFEEVTT
jgi:hypothetical protein